MSHIPEIEFKNNNIPINGFEIIRLQDLQLKTKNLSDHSPFQPHRLSFFAILVIEEGEVNHLVDFRTHNLQKDDLLLISKGQVHAFDFNAEYQGYLLIFTDTFIQKYLAGVTLTHLYRYYNYFLEQEKINHPSYTREFISIIKRELSGKSGLMPNIIGSYLGIYLMKLFEERANTISNKSNGLSVIHFNHFKRLVEQNYVKTRQANDYASELSITYKHLNAVCKEIVNITAKTFIDNYIVLEAKRKIVTSALSIKEIAFELGFDEPTNFIKYFKKHTNYTPVEFRAITA